MNETTAISAYEPQNLDQAIQMADRIAKSGLLGKTPARAETVFYLMARGKELGLSAPQAIAAFHVIDGKPSLSAEAIMGVVLGRPDVCEWFRVLESTADSCTVSTKRRNNPEPDTITVYAKDYQHLFEKDNWKNYRAAMLRARGISTLGQQVYPDLLLGLRTPDEVIEIADNEQRVIDVTPKGTDRAADSQATRAKVKGDLEDIKETGGKKVKERQEAEAAAQPTAEDIEALQEAQASAPAQDPAPELQAVEGEHIPRDGNAELRQWLVERLMEMNVDDRKAYYGRLDMTSQSVKAIREQLSDEDIDRMVGALPTASE